jgi:glutamate-1-semialdehyde 2,1-aminomutase
VLGKVIGGGMPLAAFGASVEVMSQLAPLGPVYQAGTLSGNPVATACGLATLKIISQPDFYAALSLKTQQLTKGLEAAASQAGIDFATDAQGGMFGFFLMNKLPQNYATVMTTEGQKFNRFFHGMLDRGHYFAPALYEAGFVSSAHTEEDIAATIAAAAEVFQSL